MPYHPNFMFKKVGVVSLLHVVSREHKSRLQDCDGLWQDWCALVFSACKKKAASKICLLGRVQRPSEYSAAEPPAKFAEDLSRKQEECYDVSHQTFNITAPVVISRDFPEFFFRAAGCERDCTTRKKKQFFPPIWAASCCEWGEKKRSQFQVVK